MALDYIIIQAGGKGTRLKDLTRNKPKGIVPVNNLPIIFHLFRRYPDKHFIIIGDYKHDVLEEYLEIFCKVKYLTVKAEGTGTCAGLDNALQYVPPHMRFMLVWSDLILGENIDIDSVTENCIGISEDFECRWSFLENRLREQPSKADGVAGLFIFNDKSILKNVPAEGEFVRWLSNQPIDFQRLSLSGTREIGTLLALHNVDNMEEYRCRPFNSMEVQGNTITKRPIDEQGRKLAIREISWYQEVQKYNFTQIPKIYSMEPLKMQKIDGVNIYRTSLSFDEKRRVIDNLISSLERLHNFCRVPADPFSIMEAYFHKTVSRLESVRDLIPFADQRIIRINGRNCRNPYFYKSRIRQKVLQVLNETKEFVLIHGDCTFSNTMVDEQLNIIFLDPRGYFGFSELYGDSCYDWAKLYYSIYGDYDQFNNKKFDLAISEHEILLSIETSGWQDTADYFLEKLPDCNPQKIKLLHALIWLSLTTYAWEDYDSICGAFYNGTYLLEEIL